MLLGGEVTDQLKVWKDLLSLVSILFQDSQSVQLFWIKYMTFFLGNKKVGVFCACMRGIQIVFIMWELAAYFPHKRSILLN